MSAIKYRLCKYGCSASCLQAITSLLTYMNPAPPVTRMFFASCRASNLVLPVKTGACFDNSSATYDRGFSMVEFRRAGSQLVSGEKGTYPMVGNVRLTPLVPLEPRSTGSGLCIAVILGSCVCAAMHRERGRLGRVERVPIGTAATYTGLMLMSDVRGTSLNKVMHPTCI